MSTSNNNSNNSNNNNGKVPSERKMFTDYDNATAGHHATRHENSTTTTSGLARPAKQTDAQPAVAVLILIFHGSAPAATKKDSSATGKR